MTDLTLSLDTELRTFLPGEKLSGTFSWSLDKSYRSLGVRLFWYTRGKGTQDVVIVGEQLMHAPAMAGSERFSFDLPAGPYSFSGRLITLQWAVELITIPGMDAQRIEFILSPTGKEISVDAVTA